MAQRTYTDELRAQAIARMLAGEPTKKISRELEIPNATLRSWRNVAKATPMIAPEKKVSLGDLVYELTVELARGAIAISRQFQDPEWLAKQSADGLHLSLGVGIDKLAGLLGAIQRGQDQQGQHPGLPEPGSEPDRSGAIEGETLSG